ncbi:unnamed protein product [Caenorhabditis bovis]|uniref:SAM domain-containing protein n=1 Tax=Caenorhabditis bovis TaxID=2654633 RepID=A0A8S1EYW9_9PELO|nr:unnamed protein product [Caenorhabditis bovis]
MELHHSLHSHIIGKGGRGIQRIMKLTSCHIHFPDSNKYSDANKSDQVSISGAPMNVFAAQKHLRATCPINIYMDLPWFNPGGPDMRYLGTQFEVAILSVEANVYSMVLKISTEHDTNILFAVRFILNHFGLKEEFVNVRIDVTAKDEVVALLEQNEDHRNSVQDMCAQLGVTMHTFQISQYISLFGPPINVLTIRKYIISLSTIYVTFDAQLAEILHPVNCVETEMDLQIVSKKKSGEIYTISIKSIERRIIDAFRAREILLGLPPTMFDESNDLEPSSFTSLPPPPPLQFSIFDNPPRSTSSTENIRMFLTPPIESPKSPDPEDSPLAASILKGAKEITPDLWNKKKTKPDRSEMLIKATQVIFDDTILTNSTPRYPTDLWSGYGFSCSLPADLLKGMMNLSTDDETARASRDSDPPSTRSALCSVQEEDELSDFSISSPNNCSRIIEKKPKNIFSASTSAFESPTLPYELQWDINYFTDPSMVLAQIGCSEYMTQLRDQEIDMHAFLLLDEQNLKDIGVSTIGARKKIHHAILKLRESARQNGYSI